MQKYQHPNGSSSKCLTSNKNLLSVQRSKPILPLRVKNKMINNSSEVICIVELRDENIKVIIIAFYAVKNFGERIDHVKEK